MFPAAIVQFTGGDGGVIMSLLRRGGGLYLVLFAALILFFCYFYSSIVFNTQEVSNNLKKGNCFILGVRPGSITTAQYLDKIVARLTLIGSIYLILFVLSPRY